MLRIWADTWVRRAFPTSLDVRHYPAAFFLQLRLRLPAPPAIPFHHLLWLVGDRSGCSFCLAVVLSCRAGASFLEFRPCGLARPLLTRGVAGESIALLLIVTWVLGQKVVLCFGLLGQEDRGIHRDELGPEGPLDYG